MRNRRFFWRLLPAFLLITTVSLIAIGWDMSRFSGDFHLRHVSDGLEARARLISEEATALLLEGDIDKAAERCRTLSQYAAARVTLIRRDGLVIGDSETNPFEMENHADREEIITALAGKTGMKTRYSNTLKMPMRYVAIPLKCEGEIVGVARLALSVSFLNNAVRDIQRRIALGGIVIALATAVFSLVLSRRLSRPIETINRGAERFAAGDLSRPIPVPDAPEFAALAQALNDMAAQLDERIEALVSQRGREEAILSNMVEGVLAIDAEGRLIAINHAAALALRVDRQKAIGHHVAESVTNESVRNLLERPLNQSKSYEDDVRIDVDDEPRRFRAHSNRLLDARGDAIGALLVFDDVTRLRRLETVRSDFVANVSHELKTPITSIKGFVETLLGGEVDAEDSRRFLEIIARQADRLNAIIEDLLSLSRLEQGSDRAGMPRTTTALNRTLNAAAQACELKASERDSRVTLSCDAGLTASINSPLFEQALVNLIDNAIKYSEPGSEVDVEAEREGAGVVIRVRDTGPGIPPEHIPRLFERFYRVDKARSREAGGTGLGLAIVKHIIQAHGGRVSVQSTPGAGSVFAIHLPSNT